MNDELQTNYDYDNRITPDGKNHLEAIPTLSYCEKKVNLCYNEVKRYRKDDDLCLVVTARLSLMTPAGI